MNLKGARVMLTGAAGGIGSAIAELLSQRGATLVLIGRNELALRSLTSQISNRGGIAHAVYANLLDPVSRTAAVSQANELVGGIDLLINCAGMSSFHPFPEQSPELLENIIQLNLVTPMLLTRQVLPQMLQRGSGRIVNIGSTFGSIGFAWFTAYSASKFGLRGFSEALRRELEGSGVEITYVAPRAVKTALNTGAVYRMAEATRMNLDEPQWVAKKIVAAIEADVKDLHLGSPEKFFSRLNGFLPRLVDLGLRRQNRMMGQFTSS